MDRRFEAGEKLYRAVYPPSVAELFWKENGQISSAAFADKRGLSVDRGYGRSDSEAVSCMLERLQGRIVSLTVGQCRDTGAEVLYLPSAANPYHSEIHGDKNTPALSKLQRRRLALCAVLVYSPD